MCLLCVCAYFVCVCMCACMCVLCVLLSCSGDTSGYRYEVQAKDLVPALVEAGIASPPNPHPPISAAQQDLRAVINDIRQQQQSGVGEVMLSDVTSPTASTAPRKQSSPLTGADAQLERDIYEVSRESRSPLLHVSQCCA